MKPSDCIRDTGLEEGHNLSLPNRLVGGSTLSKTSAEAHLVARDRRWGASGEKEGEAVGRSIIARGECSGNMGRGVSYCATGTTPGPPVFPSVSVRRSIVVGGGGAVGSILF